METKFISITEKIILMKNLEDGNLKSIRIIFDEINRLESIVRDYEIGIRVINEKFAGKTFKTPTLK